ncbi:MAG TPA: SDR family NAD(P)-dependent oxidoreductase, partial [Allosphingosinicella sp.]
MSDGIAVIGMACRFPDADSPEALWQTVLARRRAFRRMPAERLDLADYDEARCDPSDSIYPIEAAVLENYSFDRARHLVPASAFAAADLTHWLALDVATEALEDAGLAGGADHRARTGVVVGNTLTGEFSRAGLLRYRWPYVRRQLDSALAGEGFDPARREAFLAGFEERYKAPFPPPDEESLAGGLANTIAGRIANHHDLRGGGYTVDGACASSLLAMASACRRLQCGEVDLVLAGGVDLSLDPFELVGFARNGALSKSVMRVFDRRSDGFWPGEGCGFVVLMRAAQASAEGRTARAVIRGWGVSSDGQGGLTRPTQAGQAQAMERAYAAAGFDAGTVPLFEAHGTGTAVGDPVEIAAIAGVRGAAGAQFPAVIGSIKANIGHTKAAAGVAGLIKQVMALDRQILPAATACDDPHPLLQEQAALVTTLRESRAWPAELPLRAGVSGLGFGGINIHLALQAAGGPRRRSLDAKTRRQIRSTQDSELFLFAAENSAALRDSVEAFAALAPSLSRAEMADAAAALARVCGAAPERAMVVAASPAELTRRIGLLLGRLKDAAGAAQSMGNALPSPRAAADETFLDLAEGIGFGCGSEPRILFLFPGQAAPAHLSGGAWRERFESVAKLYPAESRAAADGGGTEVAQPAITLASRAGLAVLGTLGVKGWAALGHSLGELSALHWAGAYDGAILQRLATRRGKAMAQRCLDGGTMLAIIAPPETAIELIEGSDAVIACYNGPRDCVISGSIEDLAAIEARARSRGIGVQPLAVSHAFHSRYAAPAAAAVAALLKREQIGALGRPVYSSVAGRRLEPEDDLRALLGRQVAAPVRFGEALAAAMPKADLAIEIGPGHGLTRLAAELGGPPAVALDVGGESLAGLMLAVGSVFVLGGAASPAALFEDRFTRDFDLDRPRRFLANPCESAPSSDSRAGASPAIPGRPAAADPAVLDKAPIEVLRSLLARRLELAEEAIRPDHRLFADLHLNSIAVGQIVGQAARALGISPPATPTNFALATVEEAAAALAKGTQIAGDAGAAFPSGVDSWVRTFQPRFLLRPLSVGERGGPWRWRVVAAEGHPLARIFDENSCATGAAAVAVCLPPSPDADDLTLILEAGQAALDAGADSLLLVVQSGGGGAAAARCLSLERPDLRVVVVDLPFEDSRAAGWLLDEAAAARPGYTESRYDAGGARFCPVLETVSDPHTGPVQAVLGPGDVLLVSGGGSGIGAECALAVARRSGARVAVIGRSPVESDAVRATMARFQAADVLAAYEPADVSDAAAAACAVDRLTARLGPVTALIHAAGINRPVPLASLDLAALSDTVAVKVAGFRNLIAALDPQRLKLAVGFSSIIARLGLPGEIHYAVANEWLGIAVQAFADTNPHCRCLSLEWSVWSGVGMGERLGVIEGLARIGVAALPAPLATEMFESLIERAQSSTALVVAGRFGSPLTAELLRGGDPGGRFLDRVALHYPGIEIVAECRLSLESDPYLEEHALAGTALFPAVLGLEAMAQAASALRGGAVPDSLEEVEFRRPVVAGAEGAVLRVAALARDSDRTEMVLRAQESG